MQPISITAEGLKRKLERGEVRFTHLKKDGSTRNARATTKLESIPDELHPKNGGGVYVAYFDLDKSVWRSIAEGCEISMEVEDLMEPYDMPNLTEEEILLMLFVDQKLQDKWTTDLIGLIQSANDQQAVELSLGFKNLVRVCRMFTSDEAYAKTLSEKWRKLLDI